MRAWPVPGAGLRAAAASVLLLIGAACAPPSDDSASYDVQVDSAGFGPGTVFRFGPATADAIADPPSAPVVEGDSGQVSIHNGFFGQAPCSLPLRALATQTGDTIRVRIVSPPDTTVVGPCTEADRQAGYALLVGQFDAGEYEVHVTHEGDRARATPLDTVYEGIRIDPPRARANPEG